MKNLKRIQKIILTKLKIIFPIFLDKYQRYIVNKEKNDVSYEILSSKVDDISFCDRYGALYEYLNHLLEFSIKKKNSKRDKSFLEDLSKRFKLKSVYTTKGENNTEKTYDDLVLNNKKVIMCFTKMQNKKSLVIAVKMFFRKQKSCLF